jgi:hypothetical protein
MEDGSTPQALEEHVRDQEYALCIVKENNE